MNIIGINDYAAINGGPPKTEFDYVIGLTKACGTPEVKLNLTSLLSARKSMDTICDSIGTIEFTPRIQSLFNDEEYHQRILQRGIVQSKKFTWDKIAREIISVYEDVAK